MTDQPDSLELRITRQLPASPEDVFDAYTGADKQKIWFSILDEEPGIVEIEVDLRVGGTQTATWGRSPNGQTMTTRIEITFEPRDGGTLMTVIQSGFPRVEIRDFFTQEVWAGALARIEAFLVAQSGAGSWERGSCSPPSPWPSWSI